MVDGRARRGPLSFFANFRTAQKLMAGFLAVCLLMVGVGVVGLTRLVTVEANLEHVYVQDLQPIAWLGQVEVNTEAGLRQTLELALAKDPAAKAQDRAEIARLDALVETNWAKYTTTDIRGNEKLREDFDVTLLEYRKVQNGQLLLLLESGRTTEFVALRANLAVKLINRMTTDLTGLIGIESKIASQRVIDSTAAYQSARNLIIGITLAAVALSIALATGIGRMITRPLQETVDALEGMAEGHLNLQLGVDTHDEIGQMARALSRSMVRLNKAYEDAQSMAAIVKYTDDAIISRGVGGKILSWNPAAEKMFGYSAQGVVGKPAAFLAPEDRVGEFQALLARVGAGQPVEHLETTRIRKDGTVVPVSLTISPIRDENGAVVGESTIARDLTTQREASKLARSMIEASLDSLVSISPEGTITDANQATVRLTGVPRERLIGTSFSQYFTAPEKANEIYQRVFEQGSVTDYPLTVLRTDGQEVLTEVLYNASIYHDTGGGVLGVFAAARDVTKQMQAQRRLQEADEAIRGFTAAAAHDLRSPLVSIAGFSELLTKNWDTFTDEDRRKFVGSIDRQSHNMSRLVGDLFTSASIEGHGLSTSPELIGLAEAIDRSLETGGGHSASVDVSCSPDLMVRVDPHHLERILDNYVQNAFKYGEPPLGIEATRVGEMIRIRVLDHGPGVPPGFVSRLFGKFARADTAATRAKKGSGLGLSIVRGLAEANGGQARYEPNVPIGSCFVVELPAGEGSGG